MNVNVNPDCALSFHFHIYGTKLNCDRSGQNLHVNFFQPFPNLILSLFGFVTISIAFSHSLNPFCRSSVMDLEGTDDVNSWVNKTREIEKKNLEKQKKLFDLMEEEEEGEEEEPSTSRSNKGHEQIVAGWF